MPSNRQPKRKCGVNLNISGNSSEDDMGMRDELKNVKDRLDTVLRAVECLTKSVGDVIGRMDRFEERFAFFSNAMKEQRQVSEALREEMMSYKQRMEDLEFRVIDQEARGRRNNLLFHGVDETHREDCLKVAKELLRKSGVPDPENITIERAHRVPPHRPPTQIGNRAFKPRPLIVRFLDFTERQEVKRAKKQLPAGVTVSDDLPKEVREARKLLYPEMEAIKRSGGDCWIGYPARLIVSGVVKRSIRPKSSLSASGCSGRVPPNDVTQRSPKSPRGGADPLSNLSVSPHTVTRQSPRKKVGPPVSGLIDNVQSQTTSDVQINDDDVTSMKTVHGSGEVNTELLSVASG